GIDGAAHHRDFDVLISSIGYNDENVTPRVAAVAGKADGLILHDRMLSASGLNRIAGTVPVVTLAGTPARGLMNVRCDNEAGMRALVHHLVADHGYGTGTGFQNPSRSRDLTPPRSRAISTRR